MTSGHHCHANECRCPTPRGMLMCREHWQMVSPATQVRVYQAYKDAGGTTGPIEDAEHVPYWVACADAVEEVALREGKVIDNSYRRTAEALKRKPKPNKRRLVLRKKKKR